VFAKKWLFILEKVD